MLREFLLLQQYSELILRRFGSVKTRLEGEVGLTYFVKV
jgi:hypothetical protein